MQEKLSKGCTDIMKLSKTEKWFWKLQNVYYILQILEWEFHTTLFYKTKTKRNNKNRL